ncbi:MAG: hypothetical protein KC621_05840, partial [Myxococcales bacterium]|nr:hypothetical protein [Myxococcales bacterium]
ILGELEARVEDWHDPGTDVALAAATAHSGQHGLKQSLPRGLLDLNRGWRGRPEEKETLFGKGTLDQWVRANLRPGAEDELHAWYVEALAEVRAAARGARGLVELHGYGDLGSTYDRMAGGRPNRRSEVSVVHGAPWASPFPIGVARLVPASLRGTPWAVEARLGEQLARRGLALGPSPYPSILPWTVSARFLVERWFSWLARIGRLDAEVARRLSDLAWTDELSTELDAAVTGEATAHAWPGVRQLADVIGAWTHEGADLADTFAKEDGTFTLGVELRCDRVDRATDFGEAVADAVTAR